MSPEGFSQQAEADSLPFEEFVLKMAIGCNMQPLHELDRDPMATVHTGCDHCYMYTHSTAWQSEPEFMEPPIINQALSRIAEHAETHRLQDVRLIGHGGEPLLVLRKHPTYFADFAEAVDYHIGPTGAQSHLFIQTNGLLLAGRQGPRVIDQLMTAGFKIGLSIDGPQAANDLHRRDRAGRSTHSRAERAAQQLNEAGADWSILSVIDPRTNPEEVVEYLGSLQAKAVNLFPMHANHSAPPVQHPDALSLGEWQKRAFDRYNHWPHYHPGTVEPPFTMPIYDNYLRIAFGGYSVNDTSGESVTQELFITSGGKYERLDTLKSADDGAVRTWRNIYEHSIDEMRQDNGIIARRMGFAALAPECQGCDVLDLCFGNHYPNRFRAPEKELSPYSSVQEFIDTFKNPSIHCEDHQLFLGHVKKLVQNVPKIQPVTIRIPDDPGVLVEEKSASWFYNTLHQPYEQRQILANSLPNAPMIFSKADGFQSFPLSSDRNLDYELAAEDVETTFKAIQSNILTGREALVAAGMIAASIHPGPVAYSSEAEDRIPVEDELVLLSKDYNDAIVNSLVMLTQPCLKGVSEWGREKSGGYWFITREIADRVLANASTLQGYVIPVQLPHTDFGCQFIGPEEGIDYMASIASRSITSPIAVTALDLPGDIMIVDAPTGKSQTDALKAAVASLSHYKNPEQLAKVFATQGQGTITPLWGMWPSKTHGAEWQSRRVTAPQSERLPLPGNIPYMLDAQLQGTIVPPLVHRQPIYREILNMIPYYQEETTLDRLP